MNQRQSNCRFFYENVLHFQQEPGAGQSNPPTTMQPDQLSPAAVLVQPVGPFPEEPSLHDTEMDIDEGQNSDSIFQHPEANAHDFFLEEHPNLPRIVKEGSTFMDKFDMDEHAEERSSNLYYPFATRSEWQLAAFLLRSDLSMSAIDEFLKLDLVSFCPLPTY